MPETDPRRSDAISSEPKTSLAVVEKRVVAHGSAAVGPLSLPNTEKTA